MNDRAPYLDASDVRLPAVQAKFMYQLTLGKMLQPEPKTADDRAVAYLRAANVQWHRLDLTDVATMYASEDDIKSLRVQLGDLLVCEGGEVGRAAVFRESVKGDVIIQNSVHRVRGRNCNSTRYLGYVLQYIATAGWFDVVCNRATIAHFTVDKFGELLVPCPPPDVQEEVADNLDREVERIDRLVKAKQNLLELLSEKRRALIARAVTRGLNPDAPMRESGIEWLGATPAHWQVERARWLFGESCLPIEPDDQMVTCFRDGTVTLRSNRREDGFTNGVIEHGYQGIRKGQLVLHSMDAFAGAIGVSDSDGKCTPEYVICDPLTDKTDAHYFALLLREMALRRFVQAYCSAVRERAPRIRFNDFREFMLPVPPVEEQRAIIEFVARTTQPLARLAGQTSATLELLKERRTALIAAAVGLTENMTSPRAGKEMSHAT
jgi:type I restriction enzyme, S subunit